MDFAEKLKTWRKRKRFTQAEAAAAIGESARSWQEWEQGRRKPSGRALERLAPILGLRSRKQPPVQFAARVREFRKSFGMSRSKVAKFFGVSAGLIQDCEQERRVPRGEAMVRMIKVIAHAEKGHAKWLKWLDTNENAQAMIQAIKQSCRKRARIHTGRKKVTPGRVAGLKLELHKMEAELDSFGPETEFPGSGFEDVRKWVANNMQRTQLLQKLVPLRKKVAAMEKTIARAERMALNPPVLAARKAKREATRKPRRASPVI